jgi:hypothetical protein
VQLCHDMFFGLIGAKLRSRGANALIDLTGGGVNLSKWTNVVRARSLEMQGPFLCTMSRRPDDGGAATALAYTSGRPMVPECSTVRKDGAGGFVVYDLADERTQDVTDKQAFSDKAYDDILLALGGRSAPGADVSVALRGGRPVVAGTRPTGDVRGWHGCSTKKGRTGVLALPASALSDPLALHRAEPPSGAFDHHVVAYGGDSSMSEDDVIALLRLRAIEHRFAVAILTPSLREVVKTNRYKNIQRFKPREDVFGIDANFLGGTFDGARDGSDLGIPQRFMLHYKALVS